MSDRMKVAKVIPLTLLLAGLGLTGAVWLRSGLPEFLMNETDRADLEARRRLAADLPDRREAEIRVLERVPGPDGRDWTRLEMREKKRRIRDGESPWHPSIHLSIAGEQPRFEALVMTFADTGDRERHPLGGKSLVLFRRAYGEYTAPEDGYSFADPTRPVPPSYQCDTVPGEAERRLWSRFWNLATDPQAARREGVLVAQAKSVSTQMIPGKTYRIVVTGDGKMDIFGPFDD